MSVFHGDYEEWQKWASEYAQSLPGVRYFYTLTRNTDTPDTKSYTEGFDDGWNARGAADGKPA